MCPVDHPFLVPTHQGGHRCQLHPQYPLCQMCLEAHHSRVAPPYRVVPLSRQLPITRGDHLDQVVHQDLEDHLFLGDHYFPLDQLKQDIRAI